MRPLPEAVQAAFPCAPDRIPERPWWKRTVVGWGMSAYKRTDEQQVPVVDEQTPAAHDAASPLPHPGFRAGQVWVGERGQSVIFLSVAHDTGWVAHHVQGIRPVLLDSLAHMYPYLMADPACPWLAPWSPSEEKP